MVYLFIADIGAVMCPLLLLTVFLGICLTPGAAARHTTTTRDQRLLGLQKVYTRIPVCTTLKPESVTMNTICLSSCGSGPDDTTLVCSPQAETWKTRLAVDAKSDFSLTDDCLDGKKRYKCLPYESSEIQCMDAAFATYPVGFSCFTSCGELKCPSDDFMKPSVSDDFKLADCKSSYRVRCRIHPNNENQQINVPDLTMELQLGGRSYLGKALRPAASQ